MPTYEYRCDACGHELELFQNISAAPKRKCPACKKNRLKRLIGGGAGFLFKGSGFYLTDYRSESYRKAADAEKSPESKPAGPSTDSKSAASGGPGAAASNGSATEKPAKTPRASKNASKKGT